jgi:hypothetical protein
MPAELARVEQWMYTTLAADTTVSSIVGTRIYADEAPQQAAYPMVLFAHIGNVDIIRTGGNGRMAKVIYLVRAVGLGSSTAGNLKTVADRFDPLLLVQNVTVDGVRIAYVQHDQHHIRKDSESGVPVSYIGSYYLVFTQPA